MTLSSFSRASDGGKKAQPEDQVDQAGYCAYYFLFASGPGQREEREKALRAIQDTSVSLFYVSACQSEGEDTQKIYDVSNRLYFAGTEDDAAALRAQGFHIRRSPPYDPRVRFLSGPLSDDIPENKVR